MKQSLLDSWARDVEEDGTDTGAAYDTCNAAVVMPQRCSGKKRERTPRLKTVSSEEVSADNNGHIDVVEHSGRLLEFLRLRRQQQCSNRALAPTEDSGGNDEAVFIRKQSESRSVLPRSSPVFGLPTSEKGETQSIGYRYDAESLMQETPSFLRPQVAVRSIATQTQAETQSAPSGSSDQMTTSSLTKVDLLMLRLCELDVLLHIFFS
ncbi:uncharacterized protein Tco025E_08378 [Trypanosoma conorhini]|uniref:Uncharacterized protein n=1 Tax=Trypanosoma conorhini TaxID=83891 RepID=A0A3R7KW25_9TRYP|nr:uncharacterized protein Tco025E_08378 [Trypanosoma conorhini]RNF02503.1 hypothetical protein Tco025E_08378 [Trypanosoma conorhini]